jgi:hypothetical protein
MTYTTVLHLDSRYAVKTSNVDFYIPFTGLGSAQVVNDDGQAVSVPHGNRCPGEVFREVASVELHAIRFDGTSLTVPYVIMDVDELNNNTYSNVPAGNRSFAVIHTVHDSFNRTVKFDYQDKIRFFEPPLNTLSRLTVHFKSHENEPLDFDGFVSMILKIKHNKPL